MADRSAWLGITEDIETDIIVAIVMATDIGIILVLLLQDWQAEHFFIQPSTPTIITTTITAVLALIMDTVIHIITAPVFTVHVFMDQAIMAGVIIIAQDTVTVRQPVWSM